MLPLALLVELTPCCVEVTGACTSPVTELVVSPSCWFWLVQLPDAAPVTPTGQAPVWLIRGSALVLRTTKETQVAKRVCLKLSIRTFKKVKEVKTTLLSADGLYFSTSTEPVKCFLGFL